MLDERQLRLSREMFLAALGVPLESIDGWVIDRLTASLEEHRFETGQKLFSSGELPEFVYFLSEGEVRMTRPGRASWRHRGRWFLGGFDVHLDRPYERDAVAVSDLSVLKLAATDWIDLLEDSIWLAREAIVNCAATVAQLEERVVRAFDRAGRDEAMPPAPPGALDLVERLSFLSERPFLSGAGVQTLADLAMVAREVTLGDADSLRTRDDRPDPFRFVLSGNVYAEREDPHVTRDYGPGDIVGGVSSFGKNAAAWRLVATAPTRVLEIPAIAWFDLAEDHFDLVRSAMAALALRRQALLEHLSAQTDDLVLT